MIKKVITEIIGLFFLPILVFLGLVCFFSVVMIKGLESMGFKTSESVTLNYAVNILSKIENKW